MRIIYKIRWWWYKAQTPYYNLRRWYRFQREIYSVPREARPMFWKMQAHLTMTRTHLAADLGKVLYGSSFGKNNEFNGLANIVDDGVNVSTYKKLKKGRLPREM